LYSSLHPYSSWERGTNENTNGLIRDFWPKGYDFKQLNYYRIKKVQKLLNERPRKILNGKSPKEILEEFIKNVA
jgi:IS30 family transposase